MDKSESGELVLNFYEGNKHNELIVLGNGNFLVDGCLAEAPAITVSEKEITLGEQPGIIATSNEIQPRMRNAEWSTGRFAPESSYSIFVRTYSGNKCSWGVSTLVGLAVGVVATLIAGSLNLALGEQVAVSVLSGVASSQISHAEIYGMEDAYYSFSFDVYNSTENMTIDWSQKHVGFCYSRRDYGGTSFPHTMYYHNYLVKK